MVAGSICGRVVGWMMMKLLTLGGGGRGVLVQHKESTDFRSPQVGISVNNSPDMTTLILDKILF